MVSCQDIIAWSIVHLRSLQYFLLSYAKLIEKRAHHFLTFSPALRTSLNWWSTLGRLSKGMSLELPARLVLTTDASLLGWGAHLGDEWAQGTRSIIEASHSINWLELGHKASPPALSAKASRCSRVIPHGQHDNQSTHQPAKGNKVHVPTGNTAFRCS